MQKGNRKRSTPADPSASPSSKKPKGVSRELMQTHSEVLYKIGQIACVHERVRALSERTEGLTPLFQWMRYFDREQLEERVKNLDAVLAGISPALRYQLLMHGPMDERHHYYGVGVFWYFMLNLAGERPWSYCIGVINQLCVDMNETKKSSLLMQQPLSKANIYFNMSTPWLLLTRSKRPIAPESCLKKFNFTLYLDWFIAMEPLLRYRLLMEESTACFVNCKKKGVRVFSIILQFSMKKEGASVFPIIEKLLKGMRRADQIELLTSFSAQANREKLSGVKYVLAMVFFQIKAPQVMEFSRFIEHLLSARSAIKNKLLAPMKEIFIDCKTRVNTLLKQDNAADFYSVVVFFLTILKDLSRQPLDFSLAAQRVLSNETINIKITAYLTLIQAIPSGVVRTAVSRPTPATVFLVVLDPGSCRSLAIQGFLHRHQSSLVSHMNFFKHLKNRGVMLPLIKVVYSYLCHNREGKPDPVFLDGITGRLEAQFNERRLSI